MTNILHVKVLKARHLIKAKEVQKSDPFVKVYLKSNKQNVKKTRIVADTINPVWNDDLTFEISDLNDSVVFHVYDQAEKPVEVSSKVTTPLNIYKVGDKSKLVEVDLNLKGQPAGRLKAEISILPPESELEAAFCNFSLGSYASSYATSFSSYTCSHQLSDLHSSEEKFHKHHPMVYEDDQETQKPIRESESINGVLLNCSDLINLTNGSETYATVGILAKSQREKKSIQIVKSNSITDTNPQFNLNFDFPKVNKGNFIRIQVFQNRNNSGVLIGECIIQVKTIPENQTVEQEYQLEKPPRSKELAQYDNLGKVKLSITHTVVYK